MNVLLVIDIQNDFCPGGALAVPSGDEIIWGINEIMPQFDLVVASQDWHPADHGSFASNNNKKPGEMGELSGMAQVMWPDHCIQGSYGAGFHKDLNTGAFARVFRKGENPEVDSYSAFFDNGRLQKTGLDDYLKSKNVTDVYVCGLATDYCVKFTALDAQELGYKTALIEDLSRGVELSEGDVQRAVDELKMSGINVVNAGSGLKTLLPC